MNLSAAAGSSSYRLRDRPPDHLGAAGYVERHDGVQQRLNLIPHSPDEAAILSAFAAVLR
jgi:hypothetical protein